MKRLALAFLFSIYVPVAYSQSVSIEANQEISIDTPSGVCRNVEKFLTSSQAAFCALTGSGGLFAGGGEAGRVVKRGNDWVFLGSSCQPAVFFNVTCFRVQP
jgi:hypothetical protein